MTRTSQIITPMMKYLRKVSIVCIENVVLSKSVNTYLVNI